MTTNKVDDFEIVKIRKFGGNKVCKVRIRYNDECKNGHQSFGITGFTYGTYQYQGEDYVVVDGKRYWCDGGGCIHDTITEVFPEYAKYIKWHLCSSDGPMGYVGNTLYHAGDRDCWGLRKGQTRQIRKGGTGPLAWELKAVGPDGPVDPHTLKKYMDSDEEPTCGYTLEYVPWVRVGEGKERDFNAARSCAIWPEATDEELSAEPEILKEKLLARLPALMSEFFKDMEELAKESLELSKQQTKED